MRTGRFYTAGSRPLSFVRYPTLPISAAMAVFESANPRDAVRAALTDPLVASAIFVSSPALYAAISEDSREMDLRAAIKACAYVVRMASRATPYGLHAALAVAEVGAQTDLRLGGRERMRTSTRPDMAWLHRIVAKVEDAEAPPQSAVVRTNDLVTVAGNRLYIVDPDRFTYAPSEKSVMPMAVPSSMRTNAAVDLARELARESCRVGDLVSALSAAFALDPAASSQLVSTLWRGGVLLSAARFSPCGGGWRNVSHALAESHPAVATSLEECVDACTTLDAQPVVNRSVTAYIDVSRKLRELDGAEDVVIQVDCTGETSGTLDTRLLRDVGKFLEVVLRGGKVVDLSEYHGRFLEFYEGNEVVVPLLKLVDLEFGIGPPSSDWKTAAVPGARDALFRLVLDAVGDGRFEVALDDVKLSELLPRGELDPAALPSSLEIGVTIAAKDQMAVARGDYLLVPGPYLGTNDALRSVGRFAEMLNGETRQRIKDFAESCAERPAVEAELVYRALPRRSNNVALRSHPFEYEVALAVPTGSSEVERISPAELFVTIRNNRFFIFSPRLGREVRCHETHLLNVYTHGSPLARFLTMVSQEGKLRMRGLDTESLGPLPFIPRLTYGRCVLSPAKWFVERKALIGRDDDIHATLTRLARDRALPRWIVLVENDNWLLIDVTSAVGREILASQSASGAGAYVCLQEALPAPDEHWLESPQGRHAAEFVFNLRLPSVPPRSEGPVPLIHTRPEAAEGWLYAKLYCGTTRLDHVLRGDVAVLVEDLRARGLLRSWFFVRYRDTRTHLRLRVLPPPEMRLEAFAAIEARLVAWMSSGLIDGYAFDVYRPEYGRYGGPEALGIVQRIFALDSERVLRELVRLDIASLRARTLAAVRSADPIFRAWAASPDEVEHMLAAIRPPHRRLGPEFRSVGDALNSPGSDETPERAAQKALVAELRVLEGTGTLSTDMGSIFSSVMHMHYNRMGLTGSSEIDARTIQWRKYESERQRTKGVGR